MFGYSNMIPPQGVDRRGKYYDHHEKEVGQYRHISSTSLFHTLTHLASPAMMSTLIKDFALGD